jgi:glycosyltransferase involved in cell wall biosynthesis
VSERVVALIPALNAAPSVGAIAAECRGFAESVVVVDDGSSDATSEEATAAGAVVLRHPRNRGKGGALKTGFAWAIDNGFDGVVTLDADGQHLPKDIPLLIRCREETDGDLIIGTRTHLFDQMVFHRRVANRFSAWTISIASGARIIDSQSGFRYYSGDLLRSVHLRTDGFDMESEVIVRAGRSHLRIVNVPIDLGFVNGIVTSHYKPMHDTLRIAWTVVRTRISQ